MPGDNGELHVMKILEDSSWPHHYVADPDHQEEAFRDWNKRQYWRMPPRTSIPKRSFHKFNFAFEDLKEDRVAKVNRGRALEKNMVPAAEPDVQPVNHEDSGVKLTLETKHLWPQNKETVSTLVKNELQRQPRPTRIRIRSVYGSVYINL